MGNEKQTDNSGTNGPSQHSAEWEKEFRTGMALLHQTFSQYGEELTDVKLLGYKIGLEDLKVKELNLAFRQAIKNCLRMPSPAEIRNELTEWRRNNEVRPALPMLEEPFTPCPPEMIAELKKKLEDVAVMPTPAASDYKDEPQEITVKLTQEEYERRKKELKTQAQRLGVV